mmetsp:Transcript_1008/g.1524  ORF Transcript_1008/g.1524 Transcript_1008/m.1524 type:complete len:163 (+) Transcript_1008:62-550(+)
MMKSICFLFLFASITVIDGFNGLVGKSPKTNLKMAESDENSQPKRKKRLSQMKPKRDKPSYDFPEEEGELRPLVKKRPTQMSRLRGEDYWLDVNLFGDKKPNKKKPAENQFAEEKLKNELTSPYTKNFISLIIIAVAALIGFIQLNPGILDSYPIINFPQEL